MDRFCCFSSSSSSALDVPRNKEKKRSMFNRASIEETEEEWSLTRTIVVRKRNLWHNFHITIFFFVVVFLHHYRSTLLTLVTLPDVGVCAREHPMDWSNCLMRIECQLLINVSLTTVSSSSSIVSLIHIRLIITIALE